ncbi:MAG: hypothetical protein K0R39_4916, partial [Symbiobacteriaceae bacterium]|nr:hypothetical protein [Symbiobacteriaceae bacterium]
EVRYIGRWLPPLSVTIEHREPLPKRKPRP